MNCYIFIFDLLVILCEKTFHMDACNELQKKYRAQSERQKKSFNRNEINVI